MKLKRLQIQKLKISPKLRVILFSSAVFTVAAIALIIYANFGTSQKVIAGTGMHGAKTVSSANTILNEFTTLTANVSAGASQISVASSSINSNGRFSGALEVGSLIMIIQMQGATMTTSSPTSSSWGAVSSLGNAGKYEFAEVSGIVAGPKLNLVSALKNSYTSGGKTQIVRVPRYTTLTVNSGASITTDDWNGSTGGIVAIEVNGTTTINGSINVAGKGFRGGAVEQNSTCCPGNHTKYASGNSNDGAEKGEGIGGSQTTYDGLNGRYGKGAPANGGGGGNSHNAAGGGGSNGDIGTWDGLGNPDNSIANWVTAWNLESAGFSSHTSSGGGRGGYSYSSANANPLTKAPGNNSWGSGSDLRFNAGGLGGRALDTTGSRIYMGGGGGAGDSNDGTGSAGGDGGGIVYILTGGTLSGTGSINADGNAAANSISTSDGDGSGGGGGGGTVYIFSYSAVISNITISANGGNGGSQVYGSAINEGEGGGGGGAGGIIRTSNSSSLTRTVTGGNHGTSNATPMANFAPNGATKGSAGVISTGTINPYSGGGGSLPIKLNYFAATVVNRIVKINWVTSVEINNDYFTIERSTDGETYTPISKINGSGNSTSDIEYSSADDAPLKGTSYYRLVQTDYDGHSETFSPVVINMNDNSRVNKIISILPNPFTAGFTIDCSTVKSGLLVFTVTDLSGRVVKEVTTVAGEGINTIPVEGLGDLPQGIYFLNMTDGAQKYSTMKILKRD